MLNFKMNVSEAMGRTFARIMHPENPYFRVTLPRNTQGVNGSGIC
jgi:hypothetical protein